MNARMNLLKPRFVASRAAAASAPLAAPLASRSKYFANDPRPIILFDGVCNFCNGGIDFVLRWDSNKVFRFGALQSPPGRELLESCGRSPDDISSMVLVESDKFHLKSDAALEIAKKLSLPLPLVSSVLFPVPQFVRDGWYDLVADNRYSILGTRDTCRIPNQAELERFIY